MDSFPLLLLLFVVSGYSFKLQPRLSELEITETDKDKVSEQKRNEAVNVVRTGLESPEKTEEEGEETKPEMKLAIKSQLEKKNEDEIHRNVVRETLSKGNKGQETKGGKHSVGVTAATQKTKTWGKETEIKRKDRGQTAVELERDSELVAGIGAGLQHRADEQDVDTTTTGSEGPEDQTRQGAGKEASREIPVTTTPLVRPTTGSAQLPRDPLTEVLQSPGPHNKPEDLVSPGAENDEVQRFDAAQVVPQAPGSNASVQPNENELTPKAEVLGFKGENSNEEKSFVGLVGPQPTTSRTPLKQPAQNRRRETKTVKIKERKKKNNLKTQNSSEKKKKKKVITKEPDFPYFKDHYCPPECACYGRVVQCSDKEVDKVPYGIPYNARYILLMNNRIDGIQLDLLREYVSMEFLVLSNNRLTDGAIEGAFLGVLALKRLYLDRNLLESVPTDLPGSLEEIRLDSNRLSVMSEAAWAQCPGLQVLTLSNNSLGNGSETLLDAVLSPLHQLRTLNLDHNKLTSVPLGLPLSIKELYLKGNLIERFRGGVFDGSAELLVLDLSGNRLTDAGLFRGSFVNASRLESINLEGNRLNRVPRHLPPSLKMLNLEGNLLRSIKKVDFRALKHLEHLGLARNKILEVAPGAFRTLPVLHQLDLCHNTLHQVPRQLPPGLHTVALTHNRIGSVPRDAFCWGNRSLSLSGLVRVQLDHNLLDMGKLDLKAFRCLRGFQVVHFY